MTSGKKRRLVGADALIMSDIIRFSLRNLTTSDTLPTRQTYILNPVERT